MSEGFAVRVLSSIDAVARADWNALVDSERDSPFVDHRWLSALETTGCVGPLTGWIPSHFLVYRNGQLEGFSPAYVKDNSEGEFVYDFAWADFYRRVGEPYYPKLVFSIPFTPARGARIVCRDEAHRSAVTKAILAAASDLSREIEASSIHILFPEEKHALQLEGEDYLVRYGVQYHWENKGFTDFEDFLKSLPSKKRTQLRRERKQLALDGVTVRELPLDELEANAEAMFNFYANTVKKFPWQKRYLNLAFFRQIARDFGEYLSFVVAEHDGRMIAGAFNVKSKRVLFGRYWGAIEDRPFLHFNVCYYDGVERCIRGGRQVFEPGAGGEHKRVRGFAPTITYSAHRILNPRLQPVFVDFLARERESVRRYVESGGEGDEFG